MLLPIIANELRDWFAVAVSSKNGQAQRITEGADDYYRPGWLDLSKDKRREARPASVHESYLP